MESSKEKNSLPRMFGELHNHQSWYILIFMGLCPPNLSMVVGILLPLQMTSQEKYGSTS